LRPGWVRYGPFTLSGLVTLGIVFGFLYRMVSEAHFDPGRLGPLRAIGHQLQRVPLGAAVTEVVLAAVVLVALASTLGYVVAFWAFRLSRQDSGTLHVTRGLLTTRATTLEERRLRGVELSEPLLLRAVRGARCIAIATGLRVGRGAERGGSLLLPPAPRREARRVAAEVLGDPEPMSVALRPHGPRARGRRYVRALALAATVPAGLGLLWEFAGWPAWAPLVGLLALPAGALLAADRYRSLGHAITAGHLVVRQGSVVRRRCALARDGIIGWHLRQSIFQRRAGLVTVIATTAAGRQRYALPDVDVDASASLVDTATPELLAPFLVR
jgi:putative membrane protein